MFLIAILLIVAGVVLMAVSSRWALPVFTAGLALLLVALLLPPTTHR